MPSSGFSPPRRPLSEKQRRFVEEYLVDMNARAAARRAGYRDSNALHSLVKGHPAVQAAIEAALVQKRASASVTRDQVLAELEKVAFGNMADYLTVAGDGQLDVDVAALQRDHGGAVKRAIVEYFDDDPTRVRRVTITMNDKVAALRELSRHLGLYPVEKRRHAK